MKNSIIPEKETKILGEIFDKIEEYIASHMESTPSPEVIGKASDIEQIHTIMYLEYVKDFLSEAGALKGLLETDEEDLINKLTDNGKTPLQEIKKKVMLKSLFRSMADM